MPLTRRAVAALLGLFFAGLSPESAHAQDAGDGVVKSAIARFANAPVRAMRADTMGRLFVASGDTIYRVATEPARPGTMPDVVVRFPGNIAINDLEVRGNNLYVATQNAIYVVPDGVRGRERIEPRKLVWGIPWAPPYDGIRSLAWGPEGDLYFSLGAPAGSERWAYWTFFSSPDEIRTPYRGQGGAFRCKPDGSDLRVVAQGLRRPGRLAFDANGNLFTIALGSERATLWNVVPNTLVGPKSGMPTVLAKVEREGPWFVDEPYLPPAWRRQLIVATSTSAHGYALLPRGAGFAAGKGPQTLEASGMLASGADRLFVADAQGTIHALRLAGPDKAATFDRFEMTDAPPARLWQELSVPSFQRRFRAHLELLRRGDALAEANARLLKVEADDPALHSLIWLAAKSGRGSLHLIGLLEHRDPGVRVQVLRALAEYPEQLRDEPVFTKSLVDDDPQVRLAALLAYFSPKVAWSRPAHFAIERGPAREEDPTLRHAAACLLAQKATLAQLEGMCSRQDPALRRTGVLAAGIRLVYSSTREPLAPHLPLDEIGGMQVYFNEKVSLSTRGRVGTYLPAVHWKADKQTVEQNQLFNLLRKMLADREFAVRADAAEFLAPLGDARVAEELKRALEK